MKSRRKYLSALGRWAERKGSGLCLQTGGEACECVGMRSPVGAPAARWLIGSESLCIFVKTWQHISTLWPKGRPNQHGHTVSLPVTALATMVAEVSGWMSVHVCARVCMLWVGFSVSAQKLDCLADAMDHFHRGDMCVKVTFVRHQKHVRTKMAAVEGWPSPFKVPLQMCVFYCKINPRDLLMMIVLFLFYDGVLGTLYKENFYFEITRKHS